MRLLIFFLVLLCASCSNRNAVPDGVLSKKQMQAVLWDVMRADEMVNYYANSDSAYRKLDRNIDLYGQIFQIHGISKETFQKSIRFYQQRPDMLQPVIDSLKAQAERKTLAPVTEQ